MHNLSLSSVEVANMVVALEDRRDDLKKRIEQAEAVDWAETAAKLREDLETVRDLLKRLGAWDA